MHTETLNCTSPLTLSADCYGFFLHQNTDTITINSYSANTTIVSPSMFVRSDTYQACEEYALENNLTVDKGY